MIVLAASREVGGSAAAKIHAELVEPAQAQARSSAIRNSCVEWNSSDVRPRHSSRRQFRTRDRAVGNRRGKRSVHGIAGVLSEQRLWRAIERLTRLEENPRVHRVVVI